MHKVSKNKAQRCSTPLTPLLLFCKSKLKQLNIQTQKPYCNNHKRIVLFLFLFVCLFVFLFHPTRPKYREIKMEKQKKNSINFFHRYHKNNYSYLRISLLRNQNSSPCYHEHTYNLKFWNKFGLYFNNKGSFFCLLFIPFQSIIADNVELKLCCVIYSTAKN